MTFEGWLAGKQRETGYVCGPVWVELIRAAWEAGRREQKERDAALVEVRARQAGADAVDRSRRGLDPLRLAEADALDDTAEAIRNATD